MHFVAFQWQEIDSEEIEGENEGENVFIQFYFCFLCKVLKNCQTKTKSAAREQLKEDPGCFSLKM